MKTKIEKEERFTNSKEEVMLICVIILFSVLTTYLLSTLIGGAFYEFCKNAILWALAGVGVAFVMTYCRIKKRD